MNNNDTPQIIQLLLTPNDNNWRGMLLGLASDGNTYRQDHTDGWVLWFDGMQNNKNSDLDIEINKKLASTEQELAAVTKERDEWKKKFTDLNKDLCSELRDPNGTIWEYAEKLQKERDNLIEQRDAAVLMLARVSRELDELRLFDCRKSQDN